LYFYEDFCFWIKYNHQIFLVFCFNYFWNPGRPKLWVTSEPAGASILSIKWCILNLIFFNCFFLLNLVLTHLVYFCFGLLLIYWLEIFKFFLQSNIWWYFRFWLLMFWYFIFIISFFIKFKFVLNSSLHI